jgi:hypothetical protein
VGLMLFSVGETLVVGVVVEVDGVPDSPPPQAVNVPIEMAAAMPMPAATRRVSRRFMLQSYLVLLGDFETKLTELYRPMPSAVKVNRTARGVGYMLEIWCSAGGIGASLVDG